MAKKYYWLKLKEDFFTQPRIKKLRRIAGGDTYTLIYLKLQLLSLKNEGLLIFEGIEDNFIEELALTIDEEIDNVKFTIMYLISQNLIEEVDGSNYALVETIENIGSETDSARRVRKFRKEQEERKALQCNTLVTNCNIEIEKDKEIDIELDKEIEKKEKPKAKRFSKPTIEEIKNYIYENNFCIDASNFYDYYESNGWKVGRNAMKDWKATVRQWNAREKKNERGKHINDDMPF